MSEPVPPESEPSTPKVRGLFNQAPIAPVDADGIVVLSVGTVVFAIAAVILGVNFGKLADRGNGWWLAVACAGVGLGLVGLAYCWRHRGS